MNNRIKETVERCERWMMFDPHVRVVLQECIDHLQDCEEEITNLRKQINDLRNTKKDVSSKS